MERPIYIAGDKVSLGIFQKGDVDTLYQGINNLHIQKQLRSPMPYMYENEEKWYQSLHEEWKKQFVIIQNDTQEIIGSIGFNTWSDIHRSGELGATLYRDEYLWKGLGTEAVKLFLKLAFCFFGAHRVESFVYATNLPSLAACKKVGFRQCGLQKEARWLCGEYVDLIMLEMLVSEYNVLYPENKNA